MLEAPLGDDIPYINSVKEDTSSIFYFLFPLVLFYMELAFDITYQGYKKVQVHEDGSILRIPKSALPSHELEKRFHRSEKCMREC